MGTPGLWIGFNAFILLMLALDLGVFHRRSHAISLGEATAWSVVWVVVSLAFNLGLLHWYGRTAALEFLTGYLIEKSLSVDNIFIFVLLFKYFAVEPRYQHRVLFWGILGALVMRGAMIGLGVALIHRFEWVLYLFGAFLVYAGAQMMLQKGEEIQPERNPILRWARKFLPLTKDYVGQKFLVRETGTWRATPLFLVLLVVETTDLAFALDSIPAVFGITRDPFIVYTSNVFAILGLRAFYFLLAGVLPYFRYLSTGLSLVLMFVGVKMLSERWVHIPTGASLGIVGAVLAVAVVASVVAAQAEARGLRKARKPGERRTKTSEFDDTSVTARIRMLADEDLSTRAEAAEKLHMAGLELSHPVFNQWLTDPELATLLIPFKPAALTSKVRPSAREIVRPELGLPTVGVAVRPENFQKIRRANGSPRLAEVPPDQDAMEFELLFGHRVSLDILTTKAPSGNGAIARFLEKFGEGIQHVEYQTADVDRVTQLLRERFGQQAVYPQARLGADGTRVNFFLAATPEGKKVLIELVEARASRSAS